MTIGPERIALIEQLIRPYIRRTPIIEVSGADLGLDSDAQAETLLEQGASGRMQDGFMYSPSSTRISGHGRR